MTYARSVEAVRALEPQARMQGTGFEIGSGRYCQLTFRKRNSPSWSMVRYRYRCFAFYPNEDVVNKEGVAVPSVR